MQATENFGYSRMHYRRSAEERCNCDHGPCVRGGGAPGALIAAATSESAVRFQESQNSKKFQQ